MIIVTTNDTGEIPAFVRDEDYPNIKAYEICQPATTWNPSRVVYIWASSGEKSIKDILVNLIGG